MTPDGKEANRKAVYLQTGAPFQMRLRLNAAELNMHFGVLKVNTMRRTAEGVRARSRTPD